MRNNALCIKCGEFKPAPVAACSSCQFLPESPEDRALSVFCSSAHQLQHALPKLQQDIRDGKKIEMPSSAKGAEKLGTLPSAATQRSLPKYEMPESPKFTPGPILSKVINVLIAFVVIFLLKWLIQGVIFKR